MTDSTTRVGGSIAIGPAARFQPRVWLLRHLHALIFALGQLIRSPLNALMTSAVIGIALALPAGLSVLLENVKTVSGQWEGNAQVSAYLSQHASDEELYALAKQIERRAEVEQVTVITPAQALEEYQQLTGFEALTQTLNDVSPLPGVLVVFLSSRHSTVENVQRLAEALGREPTVDMVQSDLRWLERLNAIIVIVHRSVGVVATLFALGVLLIVGNTIRVGVQGRHDEIEIIKLVGGTDAFIRRPFLYSGFWYGLFGGALAWGLLSGSFHLLHDPVQSLATLYHSQYRLAGPDLVTVLGLHVTGALLGLAGSWFAVSRQLRLIEPS